MAAILWLQYLYTYRCIFREGGADAVINRSQIEMPQLYFHNEYII